MLLRCSASASRPRPPARCISAARAPRSTTGCSRAGRAARWCCGSRTRTASAPPRRTSARSSRRSSGWGSTTTASPSSSPGAAARHGEVVQQLLDAGLAYRSTAGPDDVRAFKEANGNRGFRGDDEGEGAVRLRVPDEGVTTVVDVVRGETPFENALQDDLVIARADGSPVYHLAVVVDDADAAHHPRRPRRRPLLQHAQARPHPAGDGRADARVRAPAAPARAGRQEALQAPRRGLGPGPARRRTTCPRRSATTSRCWAGATTRRRRSSRRSSSRSCSRSNASRSRRRSSTSRSCAGSTAATCGSCPCPS